MNGPDDGVVLGAKAIEQIAQMYREHARRMMNEMPHRARWQNHRGGKGSKRIKFDIVSVICNPDDTITLEVTPTHYTGGCTAAIPGETSYGVTVEDPCGILSHYTLEFLESGASGYATYFYPRTGTCDPEWHVDSICGSPECG